MTIASHRAYQFYSESWLWRTLGGTWLWRENRSMKRRGENEKWWFWILSSYACSNFRL